MSKEYRHQPTQPAIKFHAWPQGQEVAPGIEARTGLQVAIAPIYIPSIEDRHLESLEQELEVKAFMVRQDRSGLGRTLEWPGGGMKAQDAGNPYETVHREAIEELGLGEQEFEILLNPISYGRHGSSDYVLFYAEVKTDVPVKQLVTRRDSLNKDEERLTIVKVPVREIRNRSNYPKGAEWEHALHAVETEVAKRTNMYKNYQALLSKAQEDAAA